MTRHSMKLLFLILLLFAGFPGIESNSHAQKQNSSNESDDEPTKITKGLMTPSEERHSKLYEGVGQKLTKMKGEAYVVIGPGLNGGAAWDRPTMEQFFRSRFCNSDAVVLAKVKGHTSQLTPNEDFIFTDYTFTLETVFKSDSQISTKPLFVVSMPGGKVSLDGRILTVEDRSRTRLGVGTEVLLFLKRIPGDDAYVAIDGSGFMGDIYTPLNRHSNADQPTTPKTVVDLVSRMNSEPCVANVGGVSQ